MTLSARSACQPSRTIASAAIIAAAWPEDTFAYYVASLADAFETADRFVAHGATAFVLSPSDVDDLLAKGAWVGIQEASAGGCAAWGRAIVEA